MKSGSMALTLNQSSLPLVEIAEKISHQRREQIVNIVCMIYVSSFILSREDIHVIHHMDNQCLNDEFSIFQKRWQQCSLLKPLQPSQFERKDSFKD